MDKKIPAQNSPTEAKRAINLIAHESKANLDKVRTTPELEKAFEEAETVWSEYRTARQEVITTSPLIGEGDPLHPLATSLLSQAIKRVQVIKNEIKIFEPDAQEITGVFPKKE